MSLHSIWQSTAVLLCYTISGATLQMDNLWLAVEVHCVINPSMLQQPVNGHVVQAVCVKMRKMYLCTCASGGVQKKIRTHCAFETDKLGRRQMPRGSLPGPTMIAPPC